MPLDDEKFTSVLAEYNRRLSDEEAFIQKTTVKSEIDIDKLLIPVGEEVGRLMHHLIIGLNAKTIVELGTSYGYSTLFLANAARAVGGKVYSYDVAADKQSYARGQLDRAGLSGFVEFRLGDALSLLSSQPGPVDFVLLDIWKDLYVPCLEKIVPLLGNSGTILADNMTFPPEARGDALAYQQAVRAVPGIQATLLPIGNGIDIAVRQAFEGANGSR